MPKKQGPKYKGKLAKRLPLLPEDAHPSYRPTPRIIGQRQDEIAERLWWLFDHYRITPDSRDSWYKLACALALNHINAFQVETRGGGKRAWNTKRQYQLYCDVERKRFWLGDGNRRKQPFSAKRACELLIKNPLYREFKPGTLLRQYEERKKEFTSLMQTWVKEGRVIEKGRVKGKTDRTFRYLERSGIYFPTTQKKADKLIRRHCDRAQDEIEKQIAGQISNMSWT